MFQFPWEYVCQRLVNNSSIVVMAALWNRAGHYIFALWFLSFFFLFFLVKSQRSQIGCLHGVALV